MARSKFSGTDYSQSASRPSKQSTEGGLPISLSRSDRSLLSRIAKADQPKKHHAPKLGPGHGNGVKLTAACKQGRHAGCFSKTCECPCEHGVPSL